MIDPVTGATVYARCAMIPQNTGGKLLPPRPLHRPFKCIWKGDVTLRKLYHLLCRAFQMRCVRDADNSQLMDEYFSPLFKAEGSWHELTGQETWESLWHFKGRTFRWVASYAVTGGSEGHYIHVELTGWDRDGPDAKPTSLPLFLGKTFQGWERACQAANLIGALLGA